MSSSSSSSFLPPTSAPAFQAAIPDGLAVPTVTLAPPPGVSSAFWTPHIKPLATIPLAISLSIIAVTIIYVWKLWQREDKFYVEEIYSDDDDEEKGWENTTLKAVVPQTVKSVTGVREDRSGTPESLIAARQGALGLDTGIASGTAARTAHERRPVTPESLIAAREADAAIRALEDVLNATLNQGGSDVRGLCERDRVFEPHHAKEDMPNDFQEYAQDRAHHRETPARKPVPVALRSSPPASSPLATTLPAATQASINTNAYGPIERWNRSSNGSAFSDATPQFTSGSIAAQPRDRPPAQMEQNRGLWGPHENGSDDVLRHSGQSTNSMAGSEASDEIVVRSDVLRESGIDWDSDDDESSILESDFSKNDGSDFSRPNYTTERYGDY